MSASGLVRGKLILLDMILKVRDDCVSPNGSGLFRAMRLCTAEPSLRQIAYERQHERYVSL